MQTASFYATGLCFVAFGFAVVFSRCSLVARVLIRTASVLIAPSGAGLLMAEAFPTDPLGDPQIETGALHDLAFLVAFLPLILAYPLAALALRKVAGRDRRGDRVRGAGHAGAVGGGGTGWRGLNFRERRPRSLIAACSVIDPLSIGDSDAGSRVTLGLCVVTAKRDFPKVRWVNCNDYRCIH
jgi:hypothetical protein